MSESLCEPLSEQEIEAKHRELMDSVTSNGTKMLQIVRTIVPLQKSKARDNILTAVGWLNQDVDLLHARVAGELNKHPTERSEELLGFIMKQADLIEQSLAHVEEMLKKLRP